MMVTGLQLPFKSSPLAGMLMNSQAQDSETVQSVSFEEILKAKEKQLRQEREINSSLAAVALAAMRTLSATVPLLDPSVNAELYKADIQPALRKGLPLQPNSQIEKKQETMFAGTQNDETRVNAPISVSTSELFSVKPAETTKAPVAGEVAQNPRIKSSAPQSGSLSDINVRNSTEQNNDQTKVSDVSNTIPAETPQRIAKTFANAETTILPADADPDETVRAVTNAPQTHVSLESAQGKTSDRVVPQTLPDYAAKPLGEKISGSENIDPQANGRTPAVEVRSSSTAAPTQEVEEIHHAYIETKQAETSIEISTEDFNMIILARNFPRPDASSVLTTDTPAPEAFTRMSSLPPELPAGPRVSSEIEKIPAQPILHGKTVSVQSAESQLERMPEVKATGYQTGGPSSQTTDNVEKTVSFDGDASITFEVKASFPSPTSKPDLDTLQVPAQAQSLSDFASVESIVEQETILREARTDISSFGRTDESQQPIHESDEVNRRLVEKTFVAEQPSIGKVFDSVIDDMASEMQRVEKQNTAPTHQTDMQSPLPVNPFVTRQTAMNLEEIVVKTKKTEPGLRSAVDDVRGRELSTKNAEMPFSKNSIIDVPMDNHTFNLLRENAFSTKTRFAASVPTSSESLPIQHETDLEKLIVNTAKAEKHGELAAQAAETTVFSVNTGSLNPMPFQTTKSEEGEENVQRPMNVTADPADIRQGSIQNTEMGVRPAIEQNLDFGTKVIEKPASAAAENPQLTISSGVDTSIYNELQTELPVISSDLSEPNDFPDLTPANFGNVTVEAKTSALQPQKPLFLVGNEQPDIERSLVTKGSSESNSRDGIEELDVQTAFHADEISIPLDQLDFDSVLVQKQIKQEIVSSEPKVVISESNIHEISNEVLRSKAGAVNANKEFLHQPAIQAKVLHSTSDVQHDQSVKSQKNISFEKEIAVSQASKQTSESQQSRPDAIIAADANADSDGLGISQAPDTPIKDSQTTVFQPAPEVQQHQSVESQKNVLFEREVIQPQSFASTAELPRSKADGMTISEIDATGKDAEVSDQPAIQPKPPKTTILPFETDAQDLPSNVSKKNTSFESKDVETQGGIFEAVTDVSQTESADPTGTFSHAGTYNEAEHVISQAVSQDAPSAAIKSDVRNVTPFRDEVDWKKPVIEKQINTDEKVVEGSPPASDHPKPSSSTVIGSETKRAQTQVVNQETASVATNLDMPEVAPLQTRSNPVRQIADSEHLERFVSATDILVNVSRPAFDADATVMASHIDTESETVFVKSQTIAPETSFRVSTAQEKTILDVENVEQPISVNATRVDISERDFDVPTVHRSSEAGTDNRTVMIRTQTDPQATFVSADTNPERPNVKFKNVEKPVEVDQLVVEIAKLDPDLPVSARPSHTTTDDRPESVEPNILSQTIRSQSDMLKANSFQVEIAMEQRVTDPQTFEHEVVLDDLVGPSQTVSDTSVAASDAFADSENQPRVSNTAQEPVPANANLSMSEVAPFHAVASLEKPARDSQNVEEQVNSSSTVVSQTIVEPAEKPESTNTAGVNLEIEDQNLASVRDNRELNNRRTISQRESGTTIGEASLPASLAEDQNIGFTKVDSGKKDLRANQSSTADEKIFSVEQQHEPIETLEPASVTTNSMKESMVIGSVEKGSTTQVNLHSVEVVQQVMRQLNGRLKSGPTSMHLQLNPESLGAIDVEVVQDAQGINVTFFPEQSSTGKLLETQLSQLRQSLVDSGVQLSGLNIGQHSHSRQEGGFGHQNTNFAQHSPREPIHSTANAKEGPRAERVTGQTSEINYLI